MAFRSLSVLLAKYQKLWTSIGQAVIEKGKDSGRFTAFVEEHTELAVYAAAPGSLHMAIEPRSDATFASIAERFDELVRAGADAIRLAQALGRLNLRTRQRYADLLEELRKQDAQLLERHGDSSVFLASYQAPRILQALPQWEPSTTDVFEVTGSFTSFDADGLKFEIVAYGETYSGDVARAVVQKHPTISVGRGAYYRALIEATVTSMQGHTSLDFYLADADEMPWTPLSG
jgi:hypothetical protein